MASPIDYNTSTIVLTIAEQWEEVFPIIVSHARRQFLSNLAEPIMLEQGKHTLRADDLPRMYAFTEVAMDHLVALLTAYSDADEEYRKAINAKETRDWTIPPYDESSSRSDWDFSQVEAGIAQALFQLNGQIDTYSTSCKQLYQAFRGTNTYSERLKNNELQPIVGFPNMALVARDYVENMKHYIEAQNLPTGNFNRYMIAVACNPQLFSFSTASADFQEVVPIKYTEYCTALSPGKSSEWKSPSRSRSNSGASARRISCTGSAFLATRADEEVDFVLFTPKEQEVYAARAVVMAFDALLFTLANLKIGDEITGWEYTHTRPEIEGWLVHANPVAKTGKFKNWDLNKAKLPRRNFLDRLHIPH